MAILTVFVLILVLVTSNAFSTVGTRVKLRSVARVNVGETLEMKRKGKRVSIQDRGEYMKRKRILDQRQQYEESQGGTQDVLRMLSSCCYLTQTDLFLPS